MTRITDLTSTSAAPNGEFPVVHPDGVTVKMGVDQYQSLKPQPGAGDVGGGMLDQSVLYGVPSEVAIIHEGDGFGQAPHAVGNIYITQHVTMPTHSSGDAVNPEPYIGKGLHLKVTAMNAGTGKITGVSIANPGQMYKIGDVVTIPGETAGYSPVSNPTDNLPGSFKAKITKVEPFIFGNINGNNLNLGGGTNKFITKGDNDYASAGDPTASAASGKPPRMHEDKTAPLYYEEKYFSTTNDYDAWNTVGLEGLQGGTNDMLRNAGQQSIWANPFASVSTNTRMRGTYVSVSVAVPGSWFVVYCYRLNWGPPGPSATTTLNHNGSGSVQDGSNTEYYLNDADVHVEANPRQTPILGDTSFPRMDGIKDLTGLIKESTGYLGGIAPVCALPSRLTNAFSHNSHGSSWAHMSGPQGTSDGMMWYYSPKALYTTNAGANLMLDQKLYGGVTGNNQKPGKWDALYSSGGDRGALSTSNVIYGTKWMVGGASTNYTMNIGFCSSFYLVPASDILPQSTNL